MHNENLCIITCQLLLVCEFMVTEQTVVVARSVLLRFIWVSIIVSSMLQHQHV